MKNLQQKLNQLGAKLIVDGQVGPKTLQATYDLIAHKFRDLNWAMPVKGLVWLRLDDNLTDTFDDVVCRFINNKIDMIAPCSTTAGDYYRLNPITYQGVTGTAIALQQKVNLSHQFVSGKSWANLWTGKPYFQQVRPIKIYRDGNKDTKINRDIVTEGLYGINLHRGWSGLRNWNCSAGCQIVPDTYWEELIKPFSAGEYIDFLLLEL